MNERATSRRFARDIGKAIFAISAMSRIAAGSDFIGRPSGIGSGKGFV